MFIVQSFFFQIVVLNVGILQQYGKNYFTKRLFKLNVDNTIR